VISRPAAAAFVAGSSAIFVGAAWQLGWVCFVLSPLALAIVFWYSLAKRFTPYTQAFLGLAMAVAPVGGWLASGGALLAAEPWLLGLAFDMASGLQSIPTRFGVPGALAISRAMHVATVAVMILLGIVADLGGVYQMGVGLVAVLLAYEQSLVSASDLSQVKRAFDLNGFVGMLYLLTTATAVWWR
jgi:4-hydroxybenzoate polyprenyltransferase